MSLLELMILRFVSIYIDRCIVFRCGHGSIFWVQSRYTEVYGQQHLASGWTMPPPAKAAFSNLWTRAGQWCQVTQLRRFFLVIGDNDSSPGSTTRFSVRFCDNARMQCPLWCQKNVHLVQTDALSHTAGIPLIVWNVTQYLSRIIVKKFRILHFFTIRRYRKIARKKSRSGAWACTLLRTL